MTTFTFAFSTVFQYFGPIAENNDHLFNPRLIRASARCVRTVFFPRGGVICYLPSIRFDSPAPRRIAEIFAIFPSQFYSFLSIILASATTHLFDEQMTGLRSIDSIDPSRSITNAEKVASSLLNSIKLIGFDPLYPSRI
jgi:hypothetical protein